MTQELWILNSNQPKVRVVILTWNDIEKTSKCIGSILNSNYKIESLILVDNGSIEPCGEKLKREFPTIDLVVLEKNMGFTGGSNTGIKRALSQSCDYVFLLNNDTIVHSNAIDNLVTYMEKDRSCGMSSALLLFPGGDRISFYNATIDKNFARHIHSNISTPLNSRDWPDVETQFVPACAVILRTTTLKQIGLFDEEFGTSWEDFDFCIRCNEHGWKIVTVGNALVEHELSSTTGSISPYITYYNTRNRLICIDRYANKKIVLKKFLYLIRTFYWQIRGYGFFNWQCHKSFITAFWDFFNGRRGENFKIRSRLNKFK